MFSKVNPATKIVIPALVAGIHGGNQRGIASFRYSA
jgi:hypothetical protein